VAYAPAGLTAQRNAVDGQGFIAVFNQDGVFQEQLVTGGPLAAPWGITLAPQGFGELGGDLLVGNFSFLNSENNAFDPVTGALEGTINISPGPGQTPGGLWGLVFGNGGQGGDPNTLYFADGIDGETHGLFGAVSFVPEPSSAALLLAGLAFVGAVAGSRKRS